MYCNGVMHEAADLATTGFININLTFHKIMTKMRSIFFVQDSIEFDGFSDL